MKVKICARLSVISAFLTTVFKNPVTFQ